MDINQHYFKELPSESNNNSSDLLVDVKLMVIVKQ